MQQFIEFIGNNIPLFAAFIVVLSLLVANEVHGNITGGKRLSAMEAVRMINDREPLIVDVRPVGEFKKGHVLNAVNLPLAKLDDRVGELGKDRSRPVLVYCAMGMSSTEGVAKLKKHGFTEAYPIRGGLNAWMQSNLPVTTK